MDYFNVHFLKVKSRQLNIELIQGYFEIIDGFTFQVSEKSAEFLYKDPKLGYEARFVITPKSNIPDIHKLSAMYLDLNFFLEIPMFYPNYFVKKVLNIAKKLVDRFDFVSYNELFNDAYPFDENKLLVLYSKVKRSKLDSKPILYNQYHMIETNILNDILRYMDDLLELQKHYTESSTYVPHYFFFKTSDNKLKIAIELKENTLSVFPPHIDYVIYNKDNNAQIILFDEFFQATKKLIDPVPGFIKESYVIPNKNLKKINKILRKVKFSKVVDKLEKISHTNLLD